MSLFDKNVVPNEKGVPEKCGGDENAINNTPEAPFEYADSFSLLLPLSLIDLQKTIQEAANEPFQTIPLDPDEEDEDEIEITSDGDLSVVNEPALLEEHPKEPSPVKEHTDDTIGVTKMSMANTKSFGTYKPLSTPSSSFKFTPNGMNKFSTPLPTQMKENFNPEGDRSCKNTTKTNPTTLNDVFRPIMPPFMSDSLKLNQILELNSPRLQQKPLILLNGKSLPHEDGIKPIVPNKPLQSITNKMSTPSNNPRVHSTPYTTDVRIHTSKIMQVENTSNKPKVQCTIPVKDIFQTPANKNKYSTPLNTHVKLPHSYSTKKTPKPQDRVQRTHKVTPHHEKVLFSMPLINLPRDKFKTITVKNVHYVVLSELGKGGSSVVYDCYNMETNEYRAIKCVSLKDDNSAASFLNEVKMLEKLQNCDHIIKMYDYDIIDSESLLLVVLERGGSDLSKILRGLAKKSQTLSTDRLIHYWLELLRAVKQIHENGIVHSDLKPANFLWTESGIKLIDFGIASCIQNDMTSVVKNVQEGTFDYISPEALSANGCENEKPRFKLSYKSDVWSLGCILYQFVYRRPPYAHIGHMWTKLSAIINRQKIEYPEKDGVPVKIIETIKKCLQHDIKERPSVDCLLAEYEKCFN